jgi:hypothetical protein
MQRPAPPGLGIGRKADELALKRKKKMTVAKFKVVKTGSNVAESSKKCHGSTMAIL